MPKQRKVDHKRSDETEGIIERARQDPALVAQVLFWKGVEQLERAVDEQSADPMIALTQLGEALIKASEQCVALYERFDLPTSPQTSD